MRRPTSAIPRWLAPQWAHELCERHDASEIRSGGIARGGGDSYNPELDGNNEPPSLPSRHTRTVDFGRIACLGIAKGVCAEQVV